MKEEYGAKYMSLHVRETNRAAFSLYKDTLGFKYVFSCRFFLPSISISYFVFSVGSMMSRSNTMLMVRMPTRWFACHFSCLSS